MGKGSLPAMKELLGEAGLGFRVDAEPTKTKMNRN
jgi:hypothetical protein